MFHHRPTKLVVFNTEYILTFLRPMAGYTLSDKKWSSNIREQLGIFNINDKLRQYKINWREHIQRMDDNRLPKKV